MPAILIKDLPSRLPPKARLLGIDHSPRAWGLALSNPELTVATPLKSLRGKSFTDNLRALVPILREYEVGAIVVGMPFNADGSEGPRAQSVRDFAANLMKQGGDPLVTFYDERLSTFAARDMMDDLPGLSPEKRREVVDAIAAACILQGALDFLSRK